MGEPDRRGPAYEPLDERTTQQWRQLSARVAMAEAAGSPSTVNDMLTSAAEAEPQAPVAPAYRLWTADNLAREGRYAEAVRAFDAAVDSAQSARTFLPGADATSGALRHKAQVAMLGGDATVALAAYQDLAALPAHAAEALFHAGLVAETMGDDDRAADLYGQVADGQPTPRADAPAQLARRALQRLERPAVAYVGTAHSLADLLADALERRNLAQLDRLIGATHFSVGPVGGHVAFAEPAMLDLFYRDLLDSTVVARRTLAGSGGKLYLTTSGWRGDWFRGEVMCILTRAPKGWQWTGLAITQVHDAWLEHWRPATRQTNQPLPIPLLAPWPAGHSFKAGGQTEFAGQVAAIVVAGPVLGAILAAGFARNPCGFGPRGFYYGQGSTHDEEDAFAIDFTRYAKNVPFDNVTSGTPVLAVRNGVVVRVQAGTPSGDSSASNTVEIVHEDPANPADTNRFRSRYLHLTGPFQIRVSELMFVIVGQRLGRMDDTGNSTLDHLHFSIHDRTLPHPNVTYGRSVRPSPLDGTRLSDGDSGACVRSSNVERFPGLNFRPTIVSFGGVAVGQVATRSLTIENSAGQPVTLSYPAPTSGPFEWAAFSGTLQNRAEHTFEVRFRPVSNAIVSTRLAVTSNAPGSPHSVTLTGKGPGGFPPPEEPGPARKIDVRPDIVSFGSVPLNTVATRQVTVENQTGATVTLSFPASPPGPFEWAAFSGSLAHGTQRSFTLRFRPATSAIVSAKLTITSSTPGSPHTVTLTGKGPGGFPTP